MDLTESHKPPPIRSSKPSLAEFVLYAERSICCGERDELRGGDIGVQAVSESKFGFQVTLGCETVVEECYNVYSPSVRLGKRVKVGVIQANCLQDDGVPLASAIPFPVMDMPPLPLASSFASSSTDVTVLAGDVTSLLPGKYGTIVVRGILLLNPGVYNCASISLADGAKLIAISGKVGLCVSDSFTAARHVYVSTSFDRPASNFLIEISGYDTAKDHPTVSFGEHCFIQAILAVPHGTIAMADHTRAVGAFTGFDVVLGEEVHVTFQCGFPPSRKRDHGTQQLSGYYGPNRDPAVAPLIGPVPPDTVLTLSIALPSQDPKGMESLLQDVTNPSSPNFRRFLTPSSAATHYGAKSADYQSLKDWATSKGFAITSTFSNNLLLGVTATAAQIQTALYVNLVYRVNYIGNSFVTVDRDPSLDLSTPILRIGGLNDFRPPQSAAINATGSGNNYSSADIRTAYLGSNAYVSGLDGTGTVVGVVAPAVYDPADIAGYDALQNPAINPANVILNQTMPLPTSSDPEVSLDIEMVQAMAPGTQVRVFQSADCNLIYGAMSSMDPPLTCVTCSYNIYGSIDSIRQSVAYMALQGVCCFCLSGDWGDVGDPSDNIDFPWQTIVGGTSLSTNPLIKPQPNTQYPTPYYAGEGTWNQHPAPTGKGVTGGGVMNGINWLCKCTPYPACCGSPVPIPNWQLPIMSKSQQSSGGSLVYRNYPDVAMVADNTEFYYNKSPGGVAGTSVSTPLWAGFLALVSQYKKQVDPSSSALVGFINPTIYAIALTGGSPNFDFYAVSFNDINDGVSNYNGNGSAQGYVSVNGYDLCTGLGSPKPGLVYQLASNAPLLSSQPFNYIHWEIGTGNDDAGGGQNGSSVTLTIYATADLDLNYAFTVTLRSQSDPHWDDWTVYSNEIAIPAYSNTGYVLPPATPFQYFAGFKIHLVQDNPDIAADNWDVATFKVSLYYNQPFTASAATCQLNLVGNNHLPDGSTGLVRLSKNSGSSGNGSDSPVYKPGPGSGC